MYALREAECLFALIGTGTHTAASVRAEIEITPVQAEMLSELFGEAHASRVIAKRKAVLREFDFLVEKGSPELEAETLRRREVIQNLYKHVAVRGGFGRAKKAIKNEDDSFGHPNS
jgi:hypothetical protein